MRFSALRWSCLGIMGCWLAACSGGEEVRESFANGWQFADSLRLEVNVTDTQTPHRLVFELELDAEDYPYRNLYVRFHVTPPGGQRITTVREFLLANAAGRWTVEPSGGTLAFKQSLIQPLVFQQPGQYRFEVTQFMRHDTLPGVEAVSLRVEPLPEVPE